MNENEKAVSIEVGDKVIKFKKPIDVELANEIRQDMESIEKTEGEFMLPTNLSEDVEVESIIFNKGKSEVTEVDRTISSLKEELKLSKIKLDDSNKKIDNLTTQISELGSKIDLVSNKPEPTPEPVSTPKLEPAPEPSPVEPEPVQKPVESNPEPVKPEPANNESE